VNKDKFDIAQGNSLNTAYIAMHHDPTVGDILSNKSVRQAVAYAMDYDAYTNDLRGGAAVRPASGVPLGFLSTDKVESLKYVKNVDKAKQLIQAAGADGKEVTFSFQSGTAYDGVTTETIAAKIQSDLEAIGLKVKQNPMEAQQRLADYRAGKLQFTVSTWSPDYLDVHAYAFPFGGVKDQSPSKRIAYVDQANTDLLAKGIQEFDVAKRTDDYVQVQKNMIDDAGFIVLWQPVFQFAVPKGTTVAEPDPLYLLRVENIKPA
jgi:peptide/nickel transport system substrate-binding protein